MKLTTNVSRGVVEVEVAEEISEVGTVVAKLLVVSVRPVAVSTEVEEVGCAVVSAVELDPIELPVVGTPVEPLEEGTELSVFEIAVEPLDGPTDPPVVGAVVEALPEVPKEL